METNSRIRFSQDKLALEKKPLRVNMDLYNTSSSVKTNKFLTSNTIENSKLKKSIQKYTQAKDSPRVEFKDIFSTASKKENLKFIKSEKIKSGELKKSVKSLDFQSVKK